jgi:hypothetical protein
LPESWKIARAASAAAVAGVGWHDVIVNSSTVPLKATAPLPADAFGSDAAVPTVLDVFAADVDEVPPSPPLPPPEHAAASAAMVARRTHVVQRRARCGITADGVYGRWTGCS